MQQSKAEREVRDRLRQRGVQISSNPPVMNTLSKHTGGHMGECYVSGVTAITSDRPCLCLRYSLLPHSGVVSL